MTPPSDDPVQRRALLTLPGWLDRQIEEWSRGPRFRHRNALMVRLMEIGAEHFDPSAGMPTVAPRSRPQKPPAWEPELRELHGRGLTNPQIADELTRSSGAPVSEGLVRQRLHRLGLRSHRQR